MPHSFLSAATVATIGLTCKAVLKLGLCSMTVNGLPILLDALESDERAQGRGVVTVSNHISTLDDPLTWGIMPVRTYLRSRLTRWSLGASDIMFTNPVFSTFFRHGQVLETFRGKGVYQPAVDAAIEKLGKGDWIHLFGEGKICQPETYAHTGGIAQLQRFKWGVSRILLETPCPPTIIPMWLTGFERLMPEGRAFPYNFVPRLGARLSVTFGEPIRFEDITAALDRLTAALPDASGGEASGGSNLAAPSADTEWQRLARSEVTAVIQRAVEALGRTVSGDMLGKSSP